MFERSIIHILLHILVPALVARQFYRTKWLTAFAIMMSTMLIDLDHLFANPIYDPNRCSIGFHALHTDIAIIVYVAMFFIPKLRLLSIGLLIHILLDGIDCLWMRYL